MNFAQVKGISIPQGTVKQLAQGQTVLWKGEIWPPDTYTRLGDLRRTAASAFFNTGVAVDTSIDFDIYFSNPATRHTGNLAVFGIRRASGNTDTKNCCLYLGTNSYFSGPAVVYGGVDSSNISGGGSGTKFGGNLIKISKNPIIKLLSSLESNCLIEISIKVYKKYNIIAKWILWMPDCLIKRVRS